MPCRSLRALAARSSRMHVDRIGYEEFLSSVGRHLPSSGAARRWIATTQQCTHDLRDPSAPPATSCWTRQRHTSALVEHPHAVPHHLAEGQARTTIRSGWTCSQTACSSVKSFNSSGIGALGAVWQRSHPLESLSCQSERRFSSTGSSSSSSADHQQQATASAAAGHEHGAEEDEDVHHVRVDDDDDLEEEVACTLPDFRGVEDFSAEGMPAEQQQEAWEQGRQLLTQLKAFLVERLQVERAAVVSGTAGLSEEETQAMEGVEIDLTDEDARRVLRYALGSRLTQTHEKLIGSLGTLETQGLCTAVEMLVQLAEQSEGCLWELQLSDLLEPDGQMRFFRSMLLWKLATDSPDGAPSSASAAAAIGPEAAQAAVRDAEKRASGELEEKERGGEDAVVVDDSTLARSFTLFQDPSGAVTLQEFGAMEELLVNATESGEPMTYRDLVSEDGPTRLMRLMLSQLLAAISEDTRSRMLGMLRADVTAHRAAVDSDAFVDDPLPPDTMLLFLSENMPLILACADSQRDSVLSGLLDAYQLQTQPVRREFIPPAPGELPPEIAHSPMKPLAQEISHRITMLVNLYQPQRVAWGAYVDLTKVVRPLRAKNLMKRFKYDHPVPNRDVW